MIEDFKHYQSGHCENGVASNLLKHRGIDISEPMIFGIGSGLFFIYLPFLKVNFAPGFSYRPMPGSIFSRAAKLLGFKIKRKKFKNTQDAQQALDDNLAKQIPTGLQVGVYQLTYFPDEYRFHFNAHNLVVFGKENGQYLISDPVMDHTTTLTAEELEKVRFSKGTLAPKGHMYFPVSIPKEINWEKAIRKGIKRTCFLMLSKPPIVGVNGIKTVAKNIKKWPAKIGEKKTNHYLAQLVRMQEEIGTGGGGFRYIYAAFLQEAAVHLNEPKLKEMSKEMTLIGDKWRDFAINASRVFKKRSSVENPYEQLSDELMEIAFQEEDFFKRLKKVIK